MKRKTLLLPFIIYNSNIKYFFRIMRISLFLLFVCVFQLMAEEADAQNAEIKLSQNSMTIKQLVKEIEAQTDYLVVFGIRMWMSTRLFLLTQKQLQLQTI